jgi:hypothetical protein
MRAGLPLNHPGRWQQHASLRQKATNLQKKNKPAKKKEQSLSPAPKIVSTLISPKFGFDLD